MPLDHQLLSNLSEAAGPAGGEGPVRDILRDHLRDRVDELRTDVLGNLFAVKRGGRAGAPRILLTAHMDEAGLMVAQINANGLLRVRPAGRTGVRGLLGQVLSIGAQRIPGVIGVTPVHLTPPDDRKPLPTMDDLAVDIGVDSKEAAEAVVKRGDYAVFATRFGRVGDLLKGKALDNRAGVAVIAALLDGDYPCDVHAVFTVQEGVGARGARVAAYAVRPDVAFIVDGVAVDEIPDEDAPPPDVRLGAGPVLVLSDQGMVTSPAVTAQLRDAARAAGLPLQTLAAREGRSDTRAVQVAQAGVPAALLGIPLRYPHLPVSLAHPDDLENAVRVLRATLSRL